MGMMTVGAQWDQGVRKPGLLSKCCPGLALLSPAHLNININPGSTCKHSGDGTEAVHTHTHTHRENGSESG